MHPNRLVIVAFALAILFSAGCNRKPKTECLFGDKIPQQEFDSASNAAGDLIMYLEGEQFKELYESATEEMKTAQTRDQFKLPLDLFIRSFGPLSYSRIEELYFMTSKSREDRVMIPCNLGEPGVEDLYGMPANRELAVAVFNSRSDLEQVRVVITMEREKDAWKLRSIGLHPITMKGRSSDYYLKTAMRFREENHLRVAALYFQAAMLLQEMGVNVNEFSTKVISNQLSQIKVDYLPMGEQQLWTMPSGNTYKVYNMATAYNNGKILVQLVHMTESVSDTEKLKQQARELAEFVNANFPEYRMGFDGIRVSATSEMQEEAFTTIHNEFLFSDLPTPPGAPEVESPTAAPTVHAGETATGPAVENTIEPTPPPAPQNGSTAAVQPGVTAEPGSP